MESIKLKSVFLSDGLTVIKRTTNDASSLPERPQNAVLVSDVATKEG